MHITDLLAYKATSVLGSELTGELMKGIGSKSKQLYEYVLPLVDVYENGNEIVVVVDLPGFAKQEINLRISGNILSISARKEAATPAGTIYYSQRPTQLNRKIVLPMEVDEDEKVVGTAKYSEGVITLKIPIPKSSNIPIV